MRVPHGDAPSSRHAPSPRTPLGRAASRSSRSSSTSSDTTSSLRESSNSLGRAGCTPGRHRLESRDDAHPYRQMLHSPVPVHGACVADFEIGEEERGFMAHELACALSDNLALRAELLVQKARADALEQREEAAEARAAAAEARAAAAEMREAQTAEGLRAAAAAAAAAAASSPHAAPRGVPPPLPLQPRALPQRSHLRCGYVQQQGHTQTRTVRQGSTPPLFRPLERCQGGDKRVSSLRLQLPHLEGRQSKALARRGCVGDCACGLQLERPLVQPLGQFGGGCVLASGIWQSSWLAHGAPSTPPGAIALGAALCVAGAATLAAGLLQMLVLSEMGPEGGMYATCGRVDKDVAELHMVLATVFASWGVASTFLMGEVLLGANRWVWIDALIKQHGDYNTPGSVPVGDPTPREHYQSLWSKVMGAVGFGLAGTAAVARLSTLLLRQLRREAAASRARLAACSVATCASGSGSAVSAGSALASAGGAGVVDGVPLPPGRKRLLDARLSPLAHSFYASPEVYSYYPGTHAAARAASVTGGGSTPSASSARVSGAGSGAGGCCSSGRASRASRPTVLKAPPERPGERGEEE
ncbi:hypothetical protein FOA52_006328 [Chlamydomonas sp. UWO 241]|nr:hypothetical protein FOA52_006328 [Chlamydomonas sp. UWO 241]